MAELRIGLIGCGGIGAVHARSWEQVDGAKIVAACDAEIARAQAVAPAAFTDPDAMLSGAELDAVDICTPPNFHARIALAAIQRGLPVFCEKPLAHTPGEARWMVEAADAAGTLLMTAFCHRFHPPVEWVHGLIRAGVLGRVLMFRNRFGAHFANVYERWFSRKEAAGGGALMDTSVHSVDLFRHLAGEVASSAAACHSFSPAITEVEDSGVLVLTGESGALGVIEASWMTPNSANIVEVYGEFGAAVIDYDSGETRYRVEGEPSWTVMERNDASRFAAEARHFAAVVRGEETPRVTGRDGLRAVEIIHAAYGNRIGG